MEKKETVVWASLKICLSNRGNPGWLICLAEIDRATRSARVARTFPPCPAPQTVTGRVKYAAGTLATI